jgi:hypothetical protein
MHIITSICNGRQSDGGCSIVRSRCVIDHEREPSNVRARTVPGCGHECSMRATNTVRDLFHACLLACRVPPGKNTKICSLYCPVFLLKYVGTILI